jgi:hypothetical protein
MQQQLNGQTKTINRLTSDLEQRNNTPSEDTSGMVEQLLDQVKDLDHRLTARTMKVKTPEPFDGTRSKLRYWLTQMFTYLTVNKSKFGSEADKVLFASTYLSGAAYEWFEPFIREYQTTKYTKQAEDTKQIFESYNAFQEQLERVFRDINATRNTEREINRLKAQGDDVNSYTSRFQQLTSYLTWEDDAFMHYYEKGLPYAVREKIAFMERPKSLTKMYDLATRIGNQLRELRLMRGNHHGFHPRPQNRNFGYRANEQRRFQPRNQGANDPYGPRPMELDATVSKAKRDRRQKENLCFYCGKSGHRMNDYNQRKNKAQKPRQGSGQRKQLRANQEIKTIRATRENDN